MCLETCNSLSVMFIFFKVDKSPKSMRRAEDASLLTERRLNKKAKHLYTNIEWNWYIYKYINSQWGLGRVTKLGSLNSHAWSLFHLHVIHVSSNWRYQHCSSKRILKNAAMLTWRYWHISVILGQRFIWWSDQNDPCVPSGPTAFGSRISAGVSCKNNISFFKSNEGRNSETHSKAGSQLSSVEEKVFSTNLKGVPNQTNRWPCNTTKTVFPSQVCSTSSCLEKIWPPCAEGDCTKHSMEVSDTVYMAQCLSLSV